MRNETIPQTVLFADLFDTPLVATFDQPHASSDGGAILLKAAEARYGLIDGFARCLVEDRQSGKVRHTLEDLLAQRTIELQGGALRDGQDVTTIELPAERLGRSSIAPARTSDQRE